MPQAPRQNQVGFGEAVRIIADEWIALLINLGAVALLIGGWIAMLMFAPIVIPVGIPVTWELARRMRRGAKRIRRPEAHRILRRDTRPPILYLRPFSTDGSELDGIGEEEILSAAFSRYGPFIAIANPLVRFAPLGAYRLRPLGNAEWRAAVLELVAQAQLIIAYAGASASLIWELEQIVDGVDPRRLLIYYHSGLTISLSAHAAMAQVLPHGLPEQTGSSRFVYFDSEWWPHVIPYSGTGMTVSERLQLEFAAKDAIQMVAPILTKPGRLGSVSLGG